ncbi:MAG: hypothetical protein PHT12_03775 [Patescibacteria group bacterium]|nr:hypothetical protein [Patescibacteria group bacterium]
MLCFKDAVSLMGARVVLVSTSRPNERVARTVTSVDYDDCPGQTGCVVLNLNDNVGVESLMSDGKARTRSVYLTLEEAGCLHAKQIATGRLYGPLTDLTFACAMGRVTIALA